jgi:hypothetical protein
MLIAQNMGWFDMHFTAACSRYGIRQRPLVDYGLINHRDFSDVNGLLNNRDVIYNQCLRALLLQHVAFFHETK